jgi:hypothetical protein
MDNKERIRQREMAKLSRLRPNTGHYRLALKRLGLTSPPEAVVEPVKEVEVPVKKTTRKRKPKASE